MRYYYEKYCFDQDTLTLYFNEQPKALKSNEAKLLAFFIENKNEILSKEQILEKIWGEQSVSEQVVFQNISQLRSLFGSNAIITFPKKGYKWQLPFEIQPTLPSELVTSPYMSIKNRAGYLYLAASLLFISIVTGMFWLLPSDHSTQKTVSNDIYVFPFSSIDDSVQKQLNNFNSQIEQHRTLNNGNEKFPSTNTTSLFNFPETTKQALNASNDTILISGYLSSYNEQLIIEYKLLGDERVWSGYLIGLEEESLALSLKSIVEEVQRSGYLNEPNSALLSSKLRLLLDQQPNKQSVIYHLLQQQLNEQNYDVAKALAERLITLSEHQPDSPYMALGLFVKGMIYHQQHNYSQAIQNYNRSLEQLATGKFAEIRYKVEISLAWLAYAQQKPEKMQQHINNAAMFAQKKNDVLDHISAYMTGSILSHKQGDMLNRYKYLNTAKSLLMTHQVAEAHFAIIHFHLALFAPDQQEAESFYLKVLSLPRLAQYQWVYESSIEDLLSWYIENKQWKEASSLFDSQPKNSFNLGQRSKLLHAMKDTHAAFNVAKQAFDQARLNYKYNDALHAALLLYQLQNEVNENSIPDYKNYIMDNAPKFWLDKHKDELTNIGYFDGIAN